MPKKSIILILISVGVLILLISFTTAYYFSPEGMRQNNISTNQEPASTLPANTLVPIGVNGEGCNISTPENTFQDINLATQNAEKVCYLVVVDDVSRSLVNVDFSVFKNAIYIDIKQFSGTSFPVGITKLSSLQSLFLNNSKITTLPTDIGSLKNLVRLGLLSSSLTNSQILELQKMLPTTKIDRLPQ